MFNVFRKFRKKKIDKILDNIDSKDLIRRYLLLALGCLCVAFAFTIFFNPYGIVCFGVSGNNAYGYLKGERGVHRLVRISPFDSNKRRHTSFASVEVTPEFDNTIEVNILEKDLKIDIYRSSGPGGQGVNTTDSAVRITHLPTGIVVTCQNERSQIQNKEHCMEILKSKLYKLELDKQKETLSNMKQGQMSIAFGSGKRSYVMCPYTLVKDNESGFETSSVDKVLDGELDGFINAYLRM